ncbi:MAG: HlyD family efflux transporter periplasmic adaptor subunit, partial [Pseudomonadota bacterium]
AGALGRRARAALTVLAALGPAPGGRAAGQALVNALARVMGARRVALAEMAGARARVVALSDAATFDRRMGAVRAIADAVEEAADQEARTVVPSEGERITRFLGVLAGEAPAMVAPFAIEDRVAGALVIERAPGDDPFDGEAAALADMIAATAGPAVLAQRASERSLPAIAIGRAAAFLDRLFGPRHLGLKLAVGAIALILATAVLVTDTYRVTADARLEGAVQRALIAPFDGFIEGAEARAGDIVGAGDVLASLEEEELVLRRLRHDADRRQFDMQRARALREADVASARIAAAQMAQMEAEIALVDAMLARTRITAPFDGIVVAGDLHDAVGSPVSRGQVLFEVAPLEDWTVVLEVEEARIADLETGQTGRLLLAAFPSEPFDIVVEAITPVAATVEGAHGFEVRARLIGEDARLRPGLEGVAKIDAGEARVVWIWTRGALDWVRLKLWSLWP